jgi:glyoxylase-like metal-dependent hydrolase (beta-lactamase superfamily II)
MLETMPNRNRWMVIVVTAVMLAACSSAPEETASSPKLYIFDCGTIDGVALESFGLTAAEIATPGFATPCYLIAHPRGTLMWDVGQVPDANFPADGGEAKAGVFTAAKPLLPQIAEVGYTPADITYLAMSHYHGDHTANANAFAGSTWLVQEAEHAAMFGGDTGKFGTPENYAALKDAKTEILHGDHDVFGDGTVILKPTPGHTQGHQSLFLKLANTGPIVLSGDLYHYPEERTLNRIPTIESNPDQTRASREALETFMKETGAELWIQHDRAANASLKKAPAFYD